MSYYQKIKKGFRIKHYWTSQLLPVDLSINSTCSRANLVKEFSSLHVAWRCFKMSCSQILTVSLGRHSAGVSVSDSKMTAHISLLPLESERHEDRLP